MYQVSQLSNGLTVATAEMPHMASVSLGIWVGVGGRYEPAELNGVSHFIEHMLFKGTRRRTAKAISQAVEGVGGYLNAFTSEETTCYFSKAPQDRFDELLDVLMDMFLNSRFAPEEIEKERNVIKEEMAMYVDQPQHHVEEVLTETLWPDHPLGRSLTGTEKTLDQMTRRHLVGYQRLNYVTMSTLVAAAGNIKHDRVVKALSRFSRRFPLGRRPQFIPASSPPKRPSIRLVTKPVEQTQLALGFHTSSRHDNRRFALRLLNTLIGENMSSRLFQVVREDHGLAYSISSYLNFFDDVGSLTVTAGVETEKLHEALSLILRELHRFKEAPPNLAELRRARDYVLGQIDLSLESTENQMMWLGEQYLGYGRIVPAWQLKRRLSRVKPRAIQAAAEEFLRTDRLSLALVSPMKSTRGLAKLLIV